ncbi:hypothetical protein J2Z32_000690 [Paenibacillus turicensis]|uniref:Uncharacterized protein n=1 Tax=Paenibacillus turicensis TaxID=160487 RepID=A0ABS4FNB5_9BACL|nr:hypothetical protein [Paenibacillus turicensis]
MLTITVQIFDRGNAFTGDLPQLNTETTRIDLDRTL